VDDDIVVRMDADGSTGFDSDRDAYKIVVPGLSQLWSTTADDPETYYSINTLPEITSAVDVPVSMLAAEDGSYTIRASEYESLSAQTGIWLEDTKTGITLNIADAPLYHFTAATGDAETRFILHFMPYDFSSVPAGESSGTISLYPSPSKGSFTIAASEMIKGTSVIEIYNIMGEMVFTRKVNNLLTEEIVLNEYATGVYSAKIISPEKTRFIRFVMTK
jgi:hypothetical protein